MTNEACLCGGNVGAGVDISLKEILAKISSPNYGGSGSGDGGGGVWTSAYMRPISRVITLCEKY